MCSTKLSSTAHKPMVRSSHIRCKGRIKVSQSSNLRNVDHNPSMELMIRPGIMYWSSNNSTRQAGGVGHVFKQRRKAHTPGHAGFIHFDRMLVFVVSFTGDNNVTDVVLNPCKNCAVTFEVGAPEGMG